MAKLDKIEPKIAEALENSGFELYDMKFVNAGKHSVLRIFIEKDGGINVEDCKTASRLASEILDEEDFHSAKYTLEVSSPGIDRPLTTQKDFARAVGKHLRLRVENEKGKAKKVIGKLIKFENDILEIETNKENLNIKFEKILSGKLEIIF